MDFEKLNIIVLAWAFSKWILDLIVLESLENFDGEMNLEFEIVLQSWNWMEFQNLTELVLKLPRGFQNF